MLAVMAQFLVGFSEVACQRDWVTSYLYSVLGIPGMPTKHDFANEDMQKISMGIDQIWQTGTHLA